MKRITLLTAVMLAGVTMPALSADVGVSINIGQPGFYGQIDIGQVAPPRVIYTQPKVIQRPPRGVVHEPIYLRVPPGHSRNWAKYCSRYDACGRPVYFVRDDWYNKVYVPHYRDRNRNDFRNDDRGRDRDDRRDDDRRDRNDHDDRGRGRNDR